MRTITDLEYFTEDITAQDISMNIKQFLKRYGMLPRKQYLALSDSTEMPTIIRLGTRFFKEIKIN